MNKTTKITIITLSPSTIVLATMIYGKLLMGLNLFQDDHAYGVGLFLSAASYVAFWVAYVEYANE